MREKRTLVESVLAGVYFAEAAQFKYEPRNTETGVEKSCLFELKDLCEPNGNFPRVIYCLYRLARLAETQLNFDGPRLDLPHGINVS